MPKAPAFAVGKEALQRFLDGAERQFVPRDLVFG